MTYACTRGEGLGNHSTCIVEWLVVFTIMLRGGARGPEGKSDDNNNEIELRRQ